MPLLGGAPATTRLERARPKVAALAVHEGRTYLEQLREAGASGRVLDRADEEVPRPIARGHADEDVAASPDISVGAIEARKTRPMQKLGLSSRAEIVAYAVQRGWPAGI